MAKDIIELNSGRKIYLEFLKQWKTYNGFIEGLPHKEMNQWIIDYLIEDHKRDDDKPYLISPQVREIEYDGEYTFGKPEALPRIICVANFSSLFPTRNSNADFSDLTVIWFQDEFVFPIDLTVLEHIKSIDWDNLATNFEYEL